MTNQLKARSEMDEETQPVSATEQAKAEYQEMLAQAVPGGPLEQREVTLEVKEKLTDAQMADRGEKLVEILREIDSEKEDLAATKTGFKLRIQALQKREMVLREEIASGEGLVEVKAVEFFLPKLRKAIARNPFTLDIISERPMTLEEIEESGQPGLFPMSEEDVQKNAEAFFADDRPDPDVQPAIGTDLDESTEAELEAARERIRSGQASVPEA